MMKLKLIATTALAAALLACSPQTSDNSQTEAVKSELQLKIDEQIAGKPMLAEWTGPYGGVPPWDQLDTATFEDDLTLGMELAQMEIDAIVANPEAPTFENTIVAMERVGAPLDRASTIYGVYASNLADEGIRGIQTRMSPKFSAFYSGIYSNDGLFQRVKSVYENMDSFDLTSAEERLVTEYYQDFVRRGADLSPEKKERLAELDGRLSELSTKFGQNVLADEEGYVTVIDNEADLAGLPDWLVTAMSNLATERGHEGKWVVTNTRSSMDPFLTYSDNRELRETVWNTYYNRGDNGDDKDNNAIITEMLTLRQERAALLGFESHAHWALGDRMAKTPQNAIDLMEAVWPAAVARAKEEVADMQAIADAEGANIKIEPWDYRYYAEKVRQDKYDLDFNEVKPYMQMDKLRDGMFFMAKELFGYDFSPAPEVPVFHEDVTAWKVEKDGELVGLWYFDPFARQGKRSGAWMNAYRSQQNIGGANVRPIVSNNSNFIKAAPGEPVLISWDDANTMFHEFGHALHGLASDVTYPSQAGTSVARDYVEFPSQVLEHWLSTPEILNTYAVHYETGEPIPQELLDKMEKAATFNQGFGTVEYLASALVDMRLHMTEGEIDPDAFERETLAELGMPSEIVMRHRTPHFGHIFAGGYSAGYYSYLWSDTLTADAAEAFEEAGSYYDPVVGQAMVDNIFSVGDTIDPAVGFRQFRGRDVSIAPLMRKRGFPVPEEMQKETEE